jgi:Tfp pilus assembly protein PilO
MTWRGTLRRHWRIDAAGAAVCAAATAAVYFVGILPLLSKREARETEKRDMVLVQQHALKQKIELAALRRSLADTQRSLADKPIRLEPVGDINQRLAQISRLADQAGLRVADLQTGSMTEGVHYGATRVSMKGSGSYRTFTEYLQRLRAKFPDMAASSLDLKASGRAGSGNADFQLEACWFHEKVGGKDND